MTTPNLANGVGKPADHLANERTFLAWIRTSISMIVFGFVVAKFGITLREFLRVQGGPAHERGMSLTIGVGFMAMGVVMALVSLNRYQATRKMLDAGDFKPANAIVTLVALISAIFGIVLAVYLIFTARTL
jgi:putative membrane protein